MLTDWPIWWILTGLKLIRVQLTGADSHALNLAKSGRNVRARVGPLVLHNQNTARCAKLQLELFIGFRKKEIGSITNFIKNRLYIHILSPSNILVIILIWNWTGQKTCCFCHGPAGGGAAAGETSGGAGDSRGGAAAGETSGGAGDSGVPIKLDIWLIRKYLKGKRSEECDPNL